MPDDKVLTAIDAFTVEPEDAAANSLAIRSMSDLASVIESIPSFLVNHPKIRKLTNLNNRQEVLAYAKLHYALALAKAVGQQDKEGFIFPDFEEALIKADYELKTSLKQGTRKILESITKIFERSGETGRRGFGLRR